MRTTRVVRSDRGAVLVIVAVFCIVAIVMLAAVVDLGGMREQRKDVTLSTDAAALAAAGAAVLDGVTPRELPYECSEIPTSKAGETVEDVAREYLEKNDRTVPTVFPCEVEVTGPNSGFVVVAADEDVEYAFGSAVGVASGNVSGASIAAVSASLGGGVRPIGLCADEVSLNSKDGTDEGSPYSMKTDVLDAEKVADADGNFTQLKTSVGLVLEIEHLKNSVCANASGQRGQLNFDKKNGNGGDCKKPVTHKDGMTFAQEVGFGYYGPIPQNVDADSGDDFNKGTTTTCLNDFVDAGMRFWMPVWDTYNPPPSKSFRISHFVEVELKGYCLNNVHYPDSSPYDCQWEVTSDSDDDGDGDDDGKGKGKDKEVKDKGKSETVDWLWVTAHRVFTPSSFPTTPPATSDAEPLPPTLCAEVDTAEARAGCG